MATRFGRSGVDAGWSRKVPSDLPVSGAHLQLLLTKFQWLVPPDDPMAAFRRPSNYPVFGTFSCVFQTASWGG